MKYKIEKNTVQETLILPLYSRKLCTELYPNLFLRRCAGAGHCGAQQRAARTAAAAEAHRRRIPRRGAVERRGKGTDAGAQ